MQEGAALEAAVKGVFAAVKTEMTERSTLVGSVEVMKASGHTVSSCQTEVAGENKVLGLASVGCQAVVNREGAVKEEDETGKRFFYYELDAGGKKGSSGNGR